MQLFRFVQKYAVAAAATTSRFEEACAWALVHYFWYDGVLNF